ncbi:hypothetical protein PCANC_20809 [Puccinia coronata f. sp. avenae]|uniref:Uncharacterized protein n=1 Tax=Puccinia coronata f. sp. avenae TaxID=200324 RepID=A0A2N5U1E0_9BASI|nr:hypothetical protein PCANC_26598 [Puccinia coronata f. sp. avenae]PLW28422.1 hypothetical protein PCANC_20809 [Puccinia coronata f. sp. avenae]PLW31550.1 hypothetical protein PCASD_19116 [Puccinia coronata f. sp. avenae]
MTHTKAKKVEDSGWASRRHWILSPYSCFFPLKIDLLRLDDLDCNHPLASFQYLVHLKSHTPRPDLPPLPLGA